MWHTVITMSAFDNTEPSLHRLLIDLKQDVNRGFDQVNERIDKMVTKEHLEAEVRRIDAEKRHIESRVDGVAQGLSQKIEGDKAFNKWLIGTLIAGSGAIVATVSVILNNVGA